MAEINVQGIRAPEVGVGLGASPAPPSNAAEGFAEAIKAGADAYVAYRGGQLEETLVSEQESFSQLLDKTAGDPDKVLSVEEATARDPAVKDFLAKTGVMRQAEVQGVTPRYLMELKAEAALKDSIRKAPWAADRLRAVAANVLGFDPSGMAFRKLLAPIKEAGPTDEEKTQDVLFTSARDFSKKVDMETVLLAKHINRGTGELNRASFIQDVADLQSAYKSRANAEAELDAAIKNADLAAKRTQAAGVVSTAEREAADRTATNAAAKVAYNDRQIFDTEFGAQVESGLLILANANEQLATLEQQEEFKQNVVSAAASQKAKVRNMYSRRKAQYPQQAAVFDAEEKSMLQQIDDTVASMENLGDAQKYAKLAKAMSDKQDALLGYSDAYQTLLIFKKAGMTEVLSNIFASNAFATGDIKRLEERFADSANALLANPQAAGKLAKSDLDNLAKMTFNPDSVLTKPTKDQQLFLQGVWPSIKAGMKMPISKAQDSDVEVLMNNFATVLSLNASNQEEISKFVATQAWKPYLDKFAQNDKVKADIVGAALRANTSKYLLSEGGMRGGTDRLGSLLSSGVKIGYDAAIGQFRVIETPQQPASTVARGGAVVPPRLVQEEVSTINNLLKANDALTGYADAGAVSGKTLGDLMAMQLKASGGGSNLVVTGNLPELDEEAAAESAVEGISMEKAKEIKATRKELENITKRLQQLTGENIMRRYSPTE